MTTDLAKTDVEFWDALDAAANLWTNRINVTCNGKEGRFFPSHQASSDSMYIACKCKAPHGTEPYITNMETWVLDHCKLPVTAKPRTDDDLVNHCMTKVLVYAPGEPYHKKSLTDYCRALTNSLGGAALAGQRLWVYWYIQSHKDPVVQGLVETGGATCVSTTMSNIGVWYPAEVAGYDDETGQLIIWYAADQSLARVYIDLTFLHWGDAPPTQTEPNVRRRPVAAPIIKPILAYGPPDKGNDVAAAKDQQAGQRADSAKSDKTTDRPSDTAGTKQTAGKGPMQPSAQQNAAAAAPSKPGLLATHAPTSTKGMSQAKPGLLMSDKEQVAPAATNRTVSGAPTTAPTTRPPLAPPPDPALAALESRISSLSGCTWDSVAPVVDGLSHVFARVVPQLHSIALETVTCTAPTSKVRQAAAGAVALQGAVAQGTPTPLTLACWSVDGGDTRIRRGVSGQERIAQLQTAHQALLAAARGKGGVDVTHGRVSSRADAWPSTLYRPTGTLISTPATERVYYALRPALRATDGNQAQQLCLEVSLLMHSTAAAPPARRSSSGQQPASIAAAAAATVPAAPPAVTDARPAGIKRPVSQTTVGAGVKKISLAPAGSAQLQSAASIDAAAENQAAAAAGPSSGGAQQPQQPAAAPRPQPPVALSPTGLPVSSDTPHTCITVGPWQLVVVGLPAESEGGGDANRSALATQVFPPEDLAIHPIRRAYVNLGWNKPSDQQLSNPLAFSAALTRCCFHIAYMATQLPGMQPDGNAQASQAKEAAEKLICCLLACQEMCTHLAKTQA